MFLQNSMHQKCVIIWRNMLYDVILIALIDLIDWFIWLTFRLLGWTQDQKHFAHSADIGHITFETHAYEAILSTMNNLNRYFSHSFDITSHGMEFKFQLLFVIDFILLLILNILLFLFFITITHSHEYKLVNAEASDVLAYFNTKLSAILPYAIQVFIVRLITFFDITHAALFFY